MEELLNKLIKKWWKPFRESYINEYDFEFRDNWHTLISCHSDEDDEYTNFDTYSWRDIVSKGSWLWQFCVENGMVDTNPNYVKKREKQLRYVYDEIWEDNNKYLDDEDYEYRLIESALCDDEKLEQFLLDNIKVS